MPIPPESSGPEHLEKRIRELENIASTLPESFQAHAQGLIKRAREDSGNAHNSIEQALKWATNVSQNNVSVPRRIQPNGISDAEPPIAYDQAQKVKAEFNRGNYAAELELVEPSRGRPLMFRVRALNGMSLTLLQRAAQRAGLQLSDPGSFQVNAANIRVLAAFKSNVTEKIRESREAINVRFLNAFVEAINEGQRGVIPHSGASLRLPEETASNSQSEHWENSFRNPFGSIFQPISNALAAFPQGRREFLPVSSGVSNADLRTYARQICAFLNKSWDQGNLTGIRIATNGRLEQHGPGGSSDTVLMENFQNRLTADPKTVLQQFARQEFASGQRNWSELSRISIPRIAIALGRNLAVVDNLYQFSD